MKGIIRDILLILSGALMGVSIGYWAVLIRSLINKIVETLKVSEHQANLIVLFLSVILFAVAMRIRRSIS